MTRRGRGPGQLKCIPLQSLVDIKRDTQRQIMMQRICASPNKLARTSSSADH